MGAAVCFVIWLCGLEPPSNWRLRGSAKPSAAASSANPDQSGREILTQLHKEAASKEKKEANRYAEKTAIDFAIAVDLAQDQKYSAAIEVLENVCASLEQRQLLSNFLGISDDAGEQALLNAGYELLESWQAEESLSKGGILSKSRDTTNAIENLIANNRQLRNSLENLNAKLKTPGTGLDSLTLADKLDRLLTAREEAEKQAALLPAERQRAADAGKAAEAALVRATVLEDKLRAAETNLRKSESKVKELSTSKVTPIQVKPVGLPPLKMAMPHDEKLAYDHYAKGLGFYRDTRFSEAEREFRSAVEADDEDARYHYYLGLSQWSQGKQEDAAAHFRQGARRERENKPSQVFVKLALERIDNGALKEMNRFRP